MRRAPFQALAAVSVLTVTFFLIAICTLVITGSEKVIRHFETRPQVTAFFKDGATEEQILELRSSVERLSGVASIQYITKNDALKLYQEQNKNDPLLLEMVTADVLPASLEVRANNPDVLSQIAELMKTQDIVEEVVHQKNIIDNLLQWTRVVRIVGLGLTGFLLASSMFMVIIIISMKIANHRAEIETVRLLGGSRMQTLSPFLYEGMIYGIAGSIFGWIIAYTCLLYATPLILKFLGSIQLLPIPLWFAGAVFGAQLLLGIIIGLGSSLFAARRFLR